MRWPWHRHAQHAQHTQHAHDHTQHSNAGNTSSGPRMRVVSRPRVAHAAAEAAAAYRGLRTAPGGTASLGSAIAGPPAYLIQGRPIPVLTTERAATTAPTMPALARAAALAAQRAGRAPEEVWAEALQVWLEECARADDPEHEAGHTAGHAAGEPLAAPHRQRAWQEIEETLRLLRAS